MTTDEVKAVTNVTQERRPETPAEADRTTGLFVALGKQLRVLRERKGLNQREFGLLVGYGPDGIGAMERGVRVPRPELLEKADELLDAGGILLAVIPEAREAMKRARTRHPEWYRSYAGLEAEAVELHHYCNQVVHGLLQSEAYARAGSRNGARSSARRRSRSGSRTGFPGNRSSSAGPRRR